MQKNCQSTVLGARIPGFSLPLCYWAAEENQFLNVLISVNRDNVINSIGVALWKGWVSLESDYGHLVLEGMEGHIQREVWTCISLWVWDSSSSCPLHPVPGMCTWGGRDCCDMYGKNLCLKPGWQESESHCAAIMQELKNRAG